MGVLFITGAGISASAGIPTYRDSGSSWRDKEMERKSHASRYGNHLDELWDKHWGPVSKKMLSAEPTTAHKAIAAFQQNNPETIIATQNIDTLHERAGSDNVSHVHGVMDIRCLKCKHLKTIETKWKGKGAPVCPNCGGRKTRPAVVLFGEALNAREYKGLDYFATTASHIIVVGSSLNVWPAASLFLDHYVKPTTILINKGELPFEKFFTETYESEADAVIEEVLERVDDDLRRNQSSEA